MRRWNRFSPASSSCRARIWCIPAIASSIARRCPTQNRKLLVLGLGNLLCGDDGLGAVIVDRLSRDYDVSEGVSVVDGGTLGLSLLPLLQDFDAAILVDAVRSGDAAPGTFLRIDGDEVVPTVRQHLSVHQVGVADLLDAARLTATYPSELILLGLVPESIELGVGLSPPVRSQVPRLIEAVREEIVRFGFSIHASEHIDSDRSSSRLFDADGGTTA